jgi:hypothetical protein
MINMAATFVFARRNNVITVSSVQVKLATLHTL